MASSTIINTLKGVALLLLINLCSCTDYNYIDGGLAKGIHDCTMWEYFERQTVDWDSTRLMIEQAGMKSYFDGSRQNEQITFFGITDLVIVRYMLGHNRQLDENKEKGLPVEESDYWHKVKDIPASTCKSILEKMIIPQRFMLKDVPAGTRLKTSDGSLYIEDRGIIRVDGGRRLRWSSGCGRKRIIYRPSPEYIRQLENCFHRYSNKYRSGTLDGL